MKLNEKLFYTEHSTGTATVVQ